MGRTIGWILGLGCALRHARASTIDGQRTGWADRGSLHADEGDRSMKRSIFAAAFVGAVGALIALNAGAIGLDPKVKAKKLQGALVTAMACVREPADAIDCEGQAKHPRTAHGLLDATKDGDTITKWWIQWPNANIGVRTGQISGVVVLDIDPRKGGLESWAQLQDINGRVDTLTSHTGGGGLHLFFKAPTAELKSTSDQVAAGIDTRAEGGYVVAPPSLHISGNRYQWEGEEM